MRRRVLVSWATGLFALILMAVPGQALAQEVGFTFGRLLGDDLLERVPGVGPSQLVRFEDGGVYGARFVLGMPLFDLEASVVYSPVTLGIGNLAAVDARFVYAEVGGALKLLPGPIAPFVTGGIGLHRIGWNGSFDAYRTVGYYAGLGLRLGIGGLGARVDLRDHITPFRRSDLAPALASAIGLDRDLTLHNFELSATVMFSL